MERTEIATNISGIKPCEARRFVGELVPTALLVLAWLIISFLIFGLVDPDAVIGWPQIAGFNAVKPLQSANSRIYKPFALLKGDYNGIVLGASRELRGIEPKSSLLVGTGYRLYNFGVVDERPYEAEEIAEFAVNRMAIKTIIFDAGFTGYDFDPYSAIGYLGPFYPKDLILRWAINQYFRAAMSPRGLEDSYTTVIASLQRQRVIRHTPEGREVFPQPSPDVPYDYRGAFNATLARYLNDLLPALSPQRELWITQIRPHAVAQDGRIGRHSWDTLYCVRRCRPCPRNGGAAAQRIVAAVRTMETRAGLRVPQRRRNASECRCHLVGL